MEEINYEMLYDTYVDSSREEKALILMDCINRFINNDIIPEDDLEVLNDMGLIFLRYYSNSNNELNIIQNIINNVVNLRHQN